MNVRLGQLDVIKVIRLQLVHFGFENCIDQIPSMIAS